MFGKVLNNPTKPELTLPSDIKLQPGVGDLVSQNGIITNVLGTMLRPLDMPVDSGILPEK